MATSVRKKEIRSALRGAGLSKIDDDIVSKCIALSTSLRVSPSQMADCWEAVSLNRHLTDLNEHSFESFRTALIKLADAHNGVSPDATISSRPLISSNKRSPPPSVTPPAKRVQSAEKSDKAADSSPPNVPSSVVSSNGDSLRRVSLSLTPPKASTSSSVTPAALYEQRKGAGEVIQTWNPNELELDNRSDKPLKTARCVIDTQFGDNANVKQRYRHMNTTVEEKARLLDQRLVDMGEVMKERYGLGADGDMAGLEAVGVPRQEPVCCIGRICNDAQEGRINATSILLEGCRDESGGTRVQLDVSHLKENKTPFSLFPGQIVAVEGLNPSGRTLVAHRICEGAAPPAQQTAASELLQFHFDDRHQNGSPLKIMTVAGPYATLDGLNYQPLYDFMHQCQAESPDVVIMTGPFVDMRHDALQSGQTVIQNEDGTETLLPLETFFAEQISAVLQEYFGSDDDDIGTQFILVPSLDDATAEWVFPQPPFADKSTRAEINELSKIPGAEKFVVGSLDLNTVESVGQPSATKRVHCVSNPCTLRINELVISVTSADTLFHLGLTETNANLPPGSRMERLSQHLIQQRSFYPLFPGFKGMNVDWKKMDQFSMPFQPDVLICPSKLNAFCRPAMDHSLVVNPGFLTKGNAGGSYATIQVHPMKRETLEDVSDGGVQLSHSVTSRSRVEIKRI